MQRANLLRYGGVEITSLGLALTHILPQLLPTLLQPSGRFPLKREASYS